MSDCERETSVLRTYSSLPPQRPASRTQLAIRFGLYAAIAAQQIFSLVIDRPLRMPSYFTGVRIALLVAIVALLIKTALEYRRGSRVER